MASGFILIPFYILYLPTDVYGALTICLAFSVLIQVIVTYSFDSSLYIHYHEFKNDKQKLGTFISSAFIFMIGLGLVVGLILSVCGQLIFTWILPNSKVSFYPYGLVAVGVGIFQAIFKVHGNLLQTREKSETYLWGNVVLFFVIAVGTIIGLKLFPNTLIGPLGGRLLAGFLSTGWVLLRVFREYGVHFKSPWQQTSFSFNAYTFVYQLQQWTINYVDRFLILIFMQFSLPAVGVYDFALKCLVPVELLLNGLNATINPKIVKLISGQSTKGSTPEINRYFYGLVALILLGICVSIIVIPWVINFFIGKSDYAQSLQYLPYIALVYIFKSMRLYFVLPYSILRKMKRINIVNFFVSFFKIGLMVLLLIHWQLYGVVAASYAAFAVELVLLWYYLKDDYIMHFNAFKLLIAPMLMFLLIICVEPWASNYYPTLLHVGYGVLCVILLWLAYRRELKVIDPFKILK